MEYIEITKSEIPVRFDIDLGDGTFTLGFNYNETGDFFTVNLYRPTEEEEDEELVLGEKLTLGKPLWSDFTDKDIPAPQLIPLDLAGMETRITWDNFEKTVFLYINDWADDEDDNLQL